MINISHHGATTGVTGSCHELTVDGAGILIDCGLFQGQEQGRGASASDLSIDFPIHHIKALVLFMAKRRPNQYCGIDCRKWATTVFSFPGFRGIALGHRHLFTSFNVCNAWL